MRTPGISSPRKDARRLFLLAAALAWPAARAAAAPVTADGLTDDLVRGAIRAMVEELYRRKDPDHFWDPATWNAQRDGQAAQAGGYTPLAVLALLHAGESYQDPRLRDAVNHLEHVELSGTYSVSLRAHVWAMLPDRFEAPLAADVKWLADAFQPQAGGWSYQRKPRSDWFDNSLAQYGALALWEAAKRGVPVADGFWQRIEQRFLDGQAADGGWNYRGLQPVTGSMTAAGLTALFITEDFLHAREAVALRRDAGPTAHQTAVARGLAWMDTHFSASENPGKDTYFFYYLYGVERVGLASGYARFGGRDWFREGAAEIISRLCRVDPDTGAVTVNQRLRGTPVQIRQLAFGLLFLSRGRVPVAFEKLSTPDLAWNNRPRDVANLTRWVTGQTETALSWQIASLDDEPESWLAAPVLYLASDERLPWLGADKAGPLPDQLAKLKRYLDLGGLLLAVNEGNRPVLARSIEEAGSLMYPGQAWRTLPPDHWAYKLHFQGKGRRIPLRALGNGVRELIVLSPGGDLPAALQVNDADEATVWTTAANVYLYASEMNRPQPRLAGGHVPRAGAAPAAAALVARGRYDGRWNPEPMALPRFGETARAAGLDVRVINVDLGALASCEPRPDLVLVTGVEPHELSGAERIAIRAYAEAGGTILFETAGGRGDFTRAAEGACAELLGGDVRPILDSPIITARGLAGAVPLTRVDYRPYAREAMGIHETTPRLRAILVGGEPRVLFSREDISQALLGQPCWEISGYSPDSAGDLMSNIVRYATRSAVGAPVSPPPPG